MARYTGPVCKLCRREGVQLFLKGTRCLTDKCSVKKRPAGPGMHGAKRKKVSEFGQQLREKQKARRIYGLLEKQFRKTYEEARRAEGATGERLLQFLEMRLDSVVHKLGYADSRKQARQLVRHGHFVVNGRKTDVPSFLTKVGDVVEVKPASREKEYFKVVADVMGKKDVPIWLSQDASQMTGKVLSVPTRAEIDASSVDEQLIVEYYSR
jgi:small subunit ribosomal protein S4